MMKCAYIKLIAANLMLVLGLMLVLNNACNLHTHITENGSIIQHAHPFSDSNNENPVKHEHSKFEYLFFTHLLLLILNFSIGNIFRQYTVKKYVTRLILNTHTHKSLFYSLRAPPYAAQIS